MQLVIVEKPTKTPPKLLTRDDEKHLKATYNGQEASIFVVDANSYMKQSSRLTDALSIIRSVFLSGSLFNDKDVIGSVFANTNESAQPCETNCLEDIEMLDNGAVFSAVFNRQSIRNELVVMDLGLKLNRHRSDVRCYKSLSELSISLSFSLYL
uniref:Ku_N domain-containing protein n=1 Tax=Glossina pallidipes TaxID=7398 RepID=A0A1A9ZAI1_GLOPL